MNTISANLITRTLWPLGLFFLSQTSNANEYLTHHEDLSNAELIIQGLVVNVDLGWDSKYISQGRNNLQNGGIYWLNTAIQHNNLTTYALVGRGDSQTYTEWNIGLEYTLNLTDDLSANLGYQRIEGFSDDRCRDNELFAELAYLATPWLVPSLNYVYSTEAAGYQVEVSLHSYWNITEQLTLTPYITQGFDFKYSTEAHDGRNNLQLGLEAAYQLTSSITISGHISHSFAQGDIEQEAQENGDFSSQDQTYTGVHFVVAF